MTSHKSKAKSMLWVLAGVAIVTIFIFSYVDDWSRDLTTNTAWTDEASQTLKPLRVAKPPSVVERNLIELVDSMPGWEVVRDEVDRVDETDRSSGAAIKMHLVRTTKIMRFKDDVWVSLVDDGSSGGTMDDGSSGGTMDDGSSGGTIVHVRSQSRLGRGDLGQNPRNIKELLGRLSQLD